MMNAVERVFILLCAVLVAAICVAFVLVVLDMAGAIDVFHDDSCKEVIPVGKTVIVRDVC